MSHIEDCEDEYVGPVCWRKPTGMERRSDARMGDKDAVEALSGTGRDQGGVVATVWRGSTDDPSMGVRGSVGARRWRGDAVQGTASGGTQAGCVQGDHRGAAGGVSSVVGQSSFRRGTSGGVHGGIWPGEGLRSVGAAAGGGGGGGSVRDAGGAAGASGFCDVHASVGAAPCAGDGAGVLTAVVAAVLPPADDGGADGGGWRGRSSGSGASRGSCCSTRCVRWWCRTGARTKANWC